jgi:dTDP-4-dehydrorhamnose reductase
MIEQVVCQRPIGVFNVGSADGMSKADFAYALAAALNLPTASMQRGLSSALHCLKAYRPKDMRMNSQKFEHRMGLVLPTLIEEISSMQEAYFETA